MNIVATAIAILPFPARLISSITRNATILKPVLISAIYQASRIMGKFVLKEIHGDLFSAQTSMAHCVGADLKMGMGIAVKFKQLFGGEDELRKQNVSLAVINDNFKVNKQNLFIIVEDWWMCRA